MSRGKPLIVLVGSLTEREKITLSGVIKEISEGRKKCQKRLGRLCFRKNHTERGNQ